MSKNTIGAFEAKTHLSALLERVEQGEQIVITRHGRPVARLLPPATESSGLLADITDRVKALRAGHMLALSWETMRNERRR